MSQQPPEQSPHILEYALSHQTGVDAMMEGIAGEFVEAISGPGSTRLNEVYDRPEQKFWVALHEGEVVGTVGLVLLSNGNAVLKRMMTDRRFRGRATGLAKRLLEQALDWGKQQGVHTLYLGTMAQFQAAQRFYSKLGCSEVDLEQLPTDMQVNPIDSLHYRLQL